MLPVSEVKKVEGDELVTGLRIATDGAERVVPIEGVFIALGSTPINDLIVNSGGDNVSPQRIQGILCLQDAIGQAMVYGDKKPYITAVIVPPADWCAI